MKHTFKITLILIFIFLFAQIIGLVIINTYIDSQKTQESGETTFTGLPFNIERPEVDESTSFIYIMIAVLIGTGLLLLLIKYRKMRLWKFWFFLSVLITLTIALAAFINEIFALSLAFVLAIAKIYRPNVYVHNFTEVLIYGGLAAIFVPMINMFSVFMLLFFISIYDFYAVWKSKHMVKLAEFQTSTKLFSGLFIPYKKEEKEKTTEKEGKLVKVKNAILGGGDIGFPLIFAGVTLKTLIDSGVARNIAFFESFIVVVTSTIALFWLLIKSKKDKFYPAMPFISIGCFLGYVLILLLNSILF
ncbi:hypothetical protein HQ529_05855 [Candidatus Woesearchaeota archaeon]|nr:hypothetical protein [Candidatus Woesearchaeota archaeon]